MANFNMAEVKSELFLSPLPASSSKDPSQANHTQPQTQSTSLVPPMPSTSAAVAAEWSCELKRAKQMYWCNEFEACLKLCTGTKLHRRNLSDDQRQLLLSVHLCCLVELHKSHSLFSMAHKLVDERSEEAISWYAVGCYYYSIEQYDCAKRYFNKSAGMVPAFAPSWLAYGHCFAAEREHDQAMNCYLKAAKVLPESHLPQLYVGLEYSLTSNLKLGEKFLLETLNMNKQDAYAWHELGVLAYRQNRLPEAYAHVVRAVALLVQTEPEPLMADETLVQNAVQQLYVPVWEPLLSNLGVLACKLNMLPLALLCHRKALMLCPGNACTYTALALVHLEMGAFDTAIDMLHRSLAIRNNDDVVHCLLTKTLEVYDQHCELWNAPENSYIHLVNPDIDAM